MDYRRTAERLRHQVVPRRASGTTGGVIYYMSSITAWKSGEPSAIGAALSSGDQPIRHQAGFSPPSWTPRVTNTGSVSRSCKQIRPPARPHTHLVAISQRCKKNGFLGLLNLISWKPYTLSLYLQPAKNGLLGLKTKLSLYLQPSHTS